MKNTLLRHRILIVLVALTGIHFIAFSQQSLRSWTGAVSNKYSDPSNWSPAGLPSPTDSVVIPATRKNPQVSFIQSIDMGSLHILGGADLIFKTAVNLTLRGPLIIDSTGLMQVHANITATVGDIVVNGNFTVQPSKTPQFLCSGNLVLGPSAGFLPGNSKFTFRNPAAVFTLPSQTLYDLVIDTSIAVVTTGNIQVLHQVIVNSPLWMRPQDTLTIANGDSSALVGTGTISNGTIVRAVTQAVALGGGTYRFHEARTTINCFPVGTPPSQITMTSVPGVFPQNLDSNLVFRHYYDIHQIGGSGFRLRLSFQYDPSEAGVIAPSDLFAIYRSPDYGTTWIVIPASLFDPVSHVIVSDSITGFSRYGFGRRFQVVAGVGRKSAVASGFTLYQNYPNPFNPSTVIRYQLPVASKVTVRLYDALGRFVSDLADEVQAAGERTIRVNGEGLTSGVYFYTFEAIGVADRTKSFSRTGRMILVK